MSVKIHLKGLHYKRGATQFTEKQCLVTCKQCLKWIKDREAYKAMIAKAPKPHTQIKENSNDG